MARFTGLLGIVVLLGLGWAFSTNRRAIRLKTVAWGLGLQFAFALFVLKIDWGREMFAKAGHAVEKFLSFSVAGSSFVFGDLGMGPAGKLGLVFAFYILPTIIFVSAFFSVMYHFGVMQVIIKMFAWVMRRVLGASGVESLDVAASIFMGQTEAPLTVRPFLPSVTRSELMTIMTAGMAHVSGSIMAAYIAFGIKAEFLLSAVIMTAPGTILMAKILVPETETPLTGGREVPGAQAAAAQVKLDNGDELEKKEANVLGAIAKGTTDGLHLALNVGAMLIAFIALIALVNGILGGIHNHIAGWFPASLEQIFGVIFAPIAFVIGIPWKDCVQVGNLLGTRMAINELVAYSLLGDLANKGVLAARSIAIATFALCGFANFSSIGIQIGGISALAPNRRGDLAKLGFRAMIAGTMANLMSASIVGLLIR
jgi:CNT family concentrative nucleoside transporter